MFQSKSRQHKKQRDRVNQTPQDWNKFDGLPIRPGIFFFEAFILCKEAALQFLNVSIPDTIINMNVLTWLIYGTPFCKYCVDQEKKEYKVRSNDFLIPFYYKANKDKIESLLGRALAREEPMVVEKKHNSFFNTTQKLVMDSEGFQNFLLSGVENNSLIQNHVAPLHKGQPCFYRIVHHNKQLRFDNAKQDRLFYLTAKKKSQKVSHVVNIESQKACEIYQLKNNSALLVEAEFMAEALIHFVHIIYGLRLKAIAVDFIRDEKGVNWVTDVKNFTFDEFDRVRYLAFKSQTKEDREQGRLEVLREMNKTDKCSLCFVYYERFQVQNTITKRMLFKLNQHLTKRGVFMLQHLNQFQDQQDFCKVCDQCHALVIAELELIEVERLYARAQNIPAAKEINRVQKDEKKILKVSSIKSNLLTQWRLFFYLKGLQGVSNKLLIKEADSVYLHLKLHDFITSLEICRKEAPKALPAPSFAMIRSRKVTTTLELLGDTRSKSEPPPQEPRFQRKTTNFRNFPKIQVNADLDLDSDDSQEKPCNRVDINKIRVHFFFTELGQDEKFWKFLQNTEIEFRLTDGPFYEGKKLGEASGFPLQYFSKDKEIQLQSWTYYFFGPLPDVLAKQTSDNHDNNWANEKIFMEFTSSLKRDQTVQLENSMDLYCVNSVFFPENSYFSPITMPEEWMDIIKMNSHASFPPEPSSPEVRGIHQRALSKQGTSNTKASKRNKDSAKDHGFSHSLKIFQTVQESNLYHKQLQKVRSLSPDQRHKYPQPPSRQEMSQSSAKKRYTGPLERMCDQIDITDDKVLDEQLELIDRQFRTLQEFNTHYDPKLVYVKSRLSQNDWKLLTKERDEKKDEAELYKGKNYEISKVKLLEGKKQFLLELKKKNSQHLKAERSSTSIKDDTQLQGKLISEKKHVGPKKKDRQSSVSISRNKDISLFVSLVLANNKNKQTLEESAEKVKKREAKQSIYQILGKRFSILKHIAEQVDQRQEQQNADTSNRSLVPQFNSQEQLLPQPEGESDLRQLVKDKLSLFQTQKNFQKPPLVNKKEKVVRFPTKREEHSVITEEESPKKTPINRGNSPSTIKKQSMELTQSSFLPFIFGQPSRAQSMGKDRSQIEEEFQFTRPITGISKPSESGFKIKAKLKKKFRKAESFGDQYDKMIRSEFLSSSTQLTSSQKSFSKGLQVLLKKKKLTKNQSIKVYGLMGEKSLLKKAQ